MVVDNRVFLIALNKKTTFRAGLIRNLTRSLLLLLLLFSRMLLLLMLDASIVMIGHSIFISTAMPSMSISRVSGCLSVVSLYLDKQWPTR
jgi:hypothetical protein